MLPCKSRWCTNPPTKTFVPGIWSSFDMGDFSFRGTLLVGFVGLSLVAIRSFMQYLGFKNNSVLS
jgi:hypothetical protein